MAKNKKSKNKKNSPTYAAARNWAAVAAILTTGAGKHGDRRTRRNRSRGAQERTALADYN